MALEAVQRIDVLFDIERSINGLPADQRLTVRQERSAPLVAALEAWMREERRKLSRHSDVAGAIDYMLKRRDSFTRFWRWAARPGCSPAPIAAASAPHFSTA
jgi:hypothetical protein